MFFDKSIFLTIVLHMIRMHEERRVGARQSFDRGKG